MAEQVLSVPEVHCGHCVSSIEGAVSSLNGVKNVTVDLDRKDVTIDFDDATLSVDEIISAIEEQGYDVPKDGSVAGPKVHQIGHRPD